MGVLSDVDLVAMRTRARHRLFGALGLVLLLVVGVPLVFDRHAAAPPQDEIDPAHTAEQTRSGPAEPSSVSLPGRATGGPAPAAANAKSAAAEAGKPAEPPVPDGPGKAAAGQADPSAPVRPSQVSLAAGAGADDHPAGETGKGAGDSGKAAGDSGKAAGDSGKAAGASGKAAAESGKGASDLARPQPVPDTIPPLEQNVPGHHHDHAKGAADPAHEGKAARTAATRETAATRPDKDAAAPREAGDAQSPHGWFVQFGMFAEPARAQNLSHQLESQGFKVHDEVTHGPRGSFTLVRAGPFGTRAGADEVLARARGLGQNAFLGHQ